MADGDAMPTNIFVNLPVRDLKNSMRFYEALGYKHNPQFTDETAACIVISDTIYVMLLMHAKFKEFTPKEIADSTKVCEVIVCLSCENREAVDSFVEKALAAGGSKSGEPSAVGTSGYGIVTFVYDNAGRVQRKQDQLGDTCTYNYDLAGRMTSRNYRAAANSPMGTIADSDSFTFDRAGRMLTAINGRYTNTVTYAFDPVRRKASEALTISGVDHNSGRWFNASIFHV
jgi:uncharacterized protein